MDKIAIFGTGSVAEKLYTMLDQKKVEITAFINSEAVANEFHGVNVVQECQLGNYEWDYILVGSGYVEAITEKLIKAGIDKERIISYIFDDAVTYQNITAYIEMYLNEKYHRSKLLEWLKEGLDIPVFYPSVFWDETNAVKSIFKDFVREQTAALIAQRIKELDVKGNVAELGVYKGDFTVIIDELFADKKIYLFDTFAGFSETDIKSDKILNNKTGEYTKFKDTSVEFVLNRLKSKNVVVKKGYFPESFDLWAEKFCFVSIDFNLADPVYSALNIFYPLMETGGYILVSDYYAPFYKGTKKSVDRFCREQEIGFTPIADFYGSVLIVKMQ